MIINFIRLITIVLIILSLKNIRLGVISLLICYLLLPEMPLDLGVVALKKNHILLIVVAIFFFKYKIQHNFVIQRSPFYFLFFFFVFNLILIPLRFDLPFKNQLYYIIYDIAIVLFFPLAIWNISKKELSIVHFRKAVLVCITIIVVYGTFLTLTKGLNPWVMLFTYTDMAGRPDTDFLARYYADANRLFGRISSVFVHPMHYGAFLGFAIWYVIRIKEKIPKLWTYVLLFLLFVNIVICGVRSAIGAFLVSLVVFVVFRKNPKVMAGVITAACCLLVLLSFIPDVFDYVSSIFKDPDSSKVSGSSIEMRMNQLEGAFTEIKKCLFLGKGYGWTRYYVENFSGHPVLLGFESLVFVILCNMGLFGCLLYAIVFFLFLSYIRSHVQKEERAYFICIFAYYIAYDSITGEFGFQFFVLFYTLLLAESYMDRKILSLNNK